MFKLAFPNTHKPLSKEISRLVDTLLVIDKVKVKSSTEKHVKAISQALRAIEGSGQGSYPLHQLLSVGQLIHAEIPLDILEMLATKFDLNEFDDSGMTCLKTAILNRHYGAVRWLVQNSADCNLRVRHGLPKWGKYHAELGDVDNSYSSISLLASMKNVPMDLFDLLKTPENFNSHTFRHLPLHTAVRYGMSDNVLELIKLGAKADQPNAMGLLPTEHYEMHYTHKFHEIFLQIIPSNSFEILKSICRLVDEVDRDDEVVSTMLQCLLQRIIQMGPASVAIHATVHQGYRSVDMQLNEELIVKPRQSFKAVYLSSLLLLHLDWNILSTPFVLAPYLHSSVTQQDLNHACAIDDIWKTYLRRPKVKSLMTLCIQQTRKRMSNMNDESFMSLPVPAYIRRLLMYMDVADVISEAWRLWPECKPI